MSGASWRRRAAASLAALSVLLGACGRAVTAPPRWNVVMVLVDTLRADRLSLYGYRRPTSPRLAALAREGVWFTDVRSQAGCTFPSVNSLLSSRYPYLFLERGPHGMGMPRGVPSLAEILAERGWDTAALSASLIVRRSPSAVNKVGGFGRGFRRFDESCRQQSAECVNRRAATLLGELREPFFLYLHYLEPHQPYRPPAPVPRVFARIDASWPRWVRRGDPRPITSRLYGPGGPPGYTPADARRLGDLYDDEILHFDRQLEALLATLGAARLERTLLVVLSDHGEELLDHGHWGHCRSLAFETVLATPLVLRIPGVTAGARRAPVTNLDVVPTVLDYLALPWDGPTFDGRSLRPVIERDRPLHRYRFALQGTVRSVDDGRYKLLVDLATGQVRLFDLHADRGERHDLAPTRADLLAELRQILDRWVQSQEGKGGHTESLRRARESEAQLRAVGYL